MSDPSRETTPKPKREDIIIRSVFPGTDPTVTPEQRAEAVERAIAAVLAGDFDEVPPDAE